MSKKVIQKHFSKSAKHYDKYAVLPQKMSAILEDYISNRILIPQNKTILDIGTGTGETILKLKNKFPQNKIIGCDIAFGMLEEAEKKIQLQIPQLGFIKNALDIYLIQADAEKIPFKDKVFDLIISNATYQWIYDLKEAFLEAHRILESNGKFIFTIFGNKTLYELIASGSSKVEHLKFKNKNEIKTLLKHSGFEINDFIAKSYKLYYPSVYNLLQSLKNMGAGNVFWEKGLGGRALLEELNKNYTDLFITKNGLQATFEIFIVFAVKI